MVRWLQFGGFLQKNGSIFTMFWSPTARRWMNRWGRCLLRRIHLLGHPSGGPFGNGTSNPRGAIGSTCWWTCFKLRSWRYSLQPLLVFKTVLRVIVIDWVRIYRNSYSFLSSFLCSWDSASVRKKSFGTDRYWSESGFWNSIGMLIWHPRLPWCLVFRRYRASCIRRFLF